MASIETVILTTPVFKRRVPFSERRSSWNIPYVRPVDCRFDVFHLLVPHHRVKTEERHSKQQI